MKSVVQQHLFMLFQSVEKKKKVMLTEMKQHIQSSHNEIFLHVTANEMVDL